MSIATPAPDHASAARAELDALVPSIARLDTPPAPRAGEVVVFTLGADEVLDRRRVLAVIPDGAGGNYVHLDRRPGLT